MNYGDKFFLIMVFVYLISYIFNPLFAKSILDDFLMTLVKVIPILFLVFLFMLIINLFLKDEQIQKHIGKGSGIRGWIYTLISGIIIPSPPYVILPLLGDLEKKGMRKALVVTFLYSRNLQIAFLPVMAYYFGLLFTIIISIYVFIFAIISGIAVEKIIRR